MFYFELSSEISCSYLTLIFFYLFTPVFTYFLLFICHATLYFLSLSERLCIRIIYLYMCIFLFTFYHSLSLFLCLHISNSDNSLSLSLYLSASLSSTLCLSLFVSLSLALTLTLTLIHISYGSDDGKGAAWHPTRGFHLLRGEAISWIYTLVLLDAIFMIQDEQEKKSIEELKKGDKKVFSSLELLQI